MFQKNKQGMCIFNIIQFFPKCEYGVILKLYSNKLFKLLDIVQIKYFYFLDFIILFLIKYTSF